MSINEADYNYVNRTKKTGKTEFDAFGYRRLFFKAGKDGNVFTKFSDCVLAIDSGLQSDQASSW